MRRLGGTSCGFRLRRLAALARRNDIPLYGIVNCAPAKGCVWPVVAPARAFVRAGVWRRIAQPPLKGEVSPQATEGLLHRTPRCSVSFAPAMRFYWDVLRLDHACCLPPSVKQGGLRDVAFLFRRGSGSPVVRSQRPFGYQTL